MKLQLSDDQKKNIEWVQWKNRGGDVRAHAVDPTSEERTGKRRTLTGAIIPVDAKPAEAATERDAFSLQLVDKANENWHKHRDPKPTTATPDAKPAAKKESAKKPADPSKDFELRAEGKSASLWACEPRYVSDLLATFDRSKLDMTDSYSIKVDTTKTPGTFSIKQKGRVVAKGELARAPTSNPAPSPNI